MVAPRAYAFRFTNRCGEEWVFEYDPTKGQGVLRGSDVDWQEYRVIDGRVPGLILNDEETLWLREAWAAATSGR